MKIISLILLLNLSVLSAKNLTPSESNLFYKSELLYKKKIEQEKRKEAEEKRKEALVLKSLLKEILGIEADVQSTSYTIGSICFLLGSTPSEERIPCNGSVLPSGDPYCLYASIYCETLKIKGLDANYFYGKDANYFYGKWRIRSLEDLGEVIHFMKYEKK